MKILHAFVFIGRAVGGGTTDLVAKLASAQARRGHEVTIYASDFRVAPGDLEAVPGVRVRTFRSWLNSGFYIMPGMIPACRRELPGFDIVHLHLYRSFQNVVLRHFARAHQVPYLMDAHGSLPRFVRKPRVKAAFDRLFGNRLLRDASRCIAETEMGIKEYLDMGVEPARVVRIPPPFPVEQFRDLPARGRFRERFGIPADCRVVMFLGRIHWIKGIDILTEAFARLVPRWTGDVRLVIVGPDDGFRPEIETLVDRLSIRPKTLFTGFLAGQDKISALVDADVVVQTSRYEQGAWAPIEAVLCGTPIIVSDNSGAGEDVGRMGAGFLVRFEDREDLCERIAYVLAHPDEARVKTEQGRRYVEQHLSMAQCVAQYERLYEACRQGAGRSGT